MERSRITLKFRERETRFLDTTAVRTLLFEAYTDVTNLIDIAGDGDVPRRANPYYKKTTGAYVLICRGSGSEHLKWSDVRAILWGLKEFMVVQKHNFELNFDIAQTGHPGDYLGFGRVCYEVEDES